MAKHSVCHFEWSSTDLERTRRFLNGLFSWELKQYSDGYMVFEPPEGPGGGKLRAETVSRMLADRVLLKEPVARRNTGGGRDSSTVAFEGAAGWKVPGVARNCWTFRLSRQTDGAASK